MKNILINNGALGRQGKTTIAYTLYQQCPGYRFVTNDIDNASINLNKYIKPGELFHFDHDDQIALPDNGPFIFDFGGKPDSRILPVAAFVDLIIVPIHYQSTHELQITIKNINALKQENPNIVVVINNSKNKDDVKAIKFALASIQLDVEILEISHSAYIHRLANEGKSIFEVADANKADNTRLRKKLIPQFQELINLALGD